VGTIAILHREIAPMSIQTFSDLVGALRAGSLLTNGQVDILARELLPLFSEPRALARELVRREWLTPFQINQLFLGRGAELFLGPYLLLERLGEGGMGQVFKAIHRKMNRVAALKVIRRDKLGNQETIQRFYREIQAAAALDHPNIVSAYDADEVGGVYYFAMEYVEGRDLGRTVKENGALKFGKACEYMRQAALGLQHAFEKGMVHRDIKPSNIIVRWSGSSHHEGGPAVKILDMGVARLEGTSDESGEPLTQAHSVLGTPDFIAPEQAHDSHAADIRSDLYSLGCTFYYVLTGQVPFPANSPMEKLLKHHLEQPVPVESLRPEVPRNVARLIRWMMAKSPAKRPQTPAEVAGVLASMLVSQRPAPVTVPLALPVNPPAPAAPPDTAPEVTPEEAAADETVPEVTLEFETSDSIVKIVKAKRPAARRGKRGLLPYALAGLGVGLLAALLVVLLRYALQ
jgi:serine/threonine-protein kinase